MADPAFASVPLPEFHAPHAAADEELAARFLSGAFRPKASEARIDKLAGRLVEAIRARSGGLGGVEDFLHAYALSTREGLALMVLAEALLRVPDAHTADRLIEDKLAAGDWSHHEGGGGLLVSASAWTLGLSVRIIQPGETPEGIVESLIKRIGLPAVRTATRQAMRLLGSHFVLGQTIGEAKAIAIFSIRSICLAKAPERLAMRLVISTLMPKQSPRSVPERARRHCRRGRESR